MKSVHDDNSEMVDLASGQGIEAEVIGGDIPSRVPPRRQERRVAQEYRVKEALDFEWPKDTTGVVAETDNPPSLPHEAKRAIYAEQHQYQAFTDEGADAIANELLADRNNPTQSVSGPDLEDMEVDCLVSPSAFGIEGFDGKEGNEAQLPDSETVYPSPSRTSDVIVDLFGGHAEESVDASQGHLPEWQGVNAAIEEDSLKQVRSSAPAPVDDMNMESDKTQEQISNPPSGAVAASNSDVVYESISLETPERVVNPAAGPSNLFNRRISAAKPPLSASRPYIVGTSDSGPRNLTNFKQSSYSTPSLRAYKNYRDHRLEHRKEGKFSGERYIFENVGGRVESFSDGKAVEVHNNPPPDSDVIEKEVLPVSMSPHPKARRTARTHQLPTEERRHTEPILQNWERDEAPVPPMPRVESEPIALFEEDAPNASSRHRYVLGNIGGKWVHKITHSAKKFKRKISSLVRGRKRKRNEDREYIEEQNQNEDLRVGEEENEHLEDEVSSLGSKSLREIAAEAVARSSKDIGIKRRRISLDPNQFTEDEIETLQTLRILKKKEKEQLEARQGNRKSCPQGIENAGNNTEKDGNGELGIPIDANLFTEEETRRLKGLGIFNNKRRKR